MNMLDRVEPMRREFLRKQTEWYREQVQRPPKGEWIYAPREISGVREEWCDQVIETMQNNGEYFEARVGNATLDYRTRDVDIWSLEDPNLIRDIKDLIWTTNETHWQYRLFDIETPQLCVYYGENKSHYHWHRDSTNYYHDEIGRRTLSMSLLLNNSDQFTGGELEIMDGLHEGRPMISTAALKNAGDFVIFPSDLYHRVRPVTKGTRAVLIVWCWGTDKREILYKSKT